MSEETTTLPVLPTPPPAKSFVAHAKLIGALTLLSRILGMARESVSAEFFGAGIVSSAFIVAFSIPNLFRKLFGEGALSAAFIPLYTKALREDSAARISPSPGTPGEGRGECGSDIADPLPETEAPTPTLPRSTGRGSPHSSTPSSDFAAASVNLLCIILLAITLLGEVAIAVVCVLHHDMRPDWLLTLKFTAIMLPYVILICGTAFLSSILQVHRRFGLPAFAPVLLNVIHIAVITIGARALHLHHARRATAFDPETIARQTTLAYWLGFFVLIAGVLQVMLLLPSLRQVGFRMRWVRHFWTPQVRRMLMMTLPVALGASVLQISVLMDKGLSLILARGVDKSGHIIDTFHLFGRTIHCPMEVGAAARLNWAQFLYQFPLGVFAIALATAIFPGLGAAALEEDQTHFKSVLRTGIEATLFEGFAASIGLMVVRAPAAQLLFHLTPHDSELISRSVLFYASAIWAFSMLQIINRAYFALHDTKTPLVMSIVNILINLIVELPLIWIPSLGESALAIGTAVSFAVQAIVMLWMLDRRLGGLGLAKIAPGILKMLAASAVMGTACLAVQHSPLYPRGDSWIPCLKQLLLLMTLGATVYLGLCLAMGVDVMWQLVPRRFRRGLTSAP